MMQPKTSKQYALFIICISLVSQSIILIVNDVNLISSNLSLFIATVTVISVAYVSQKLTSPANLLIYSSFVFLGCRPFFSILGSYDYRLADWFIEGYLDDDVITANYAITLMYYGYSFALLLSNNRVEKLTDSVLYTKPAINIKLLFGFYILGVIGMILKGLFFYSFISSNSYVGIYQGGIQVPVGYDFLSYLFYCSFFLLCSFYKKYRSNAIFLFISIIVAAFSALKGSRSEFITFFLTVIAIFFNERKTHNITLLIKMLVILFVVFALSEFISMWRSGGSFIELIEGNNPLVNFIYGMGVSYLSLYQSVKLSLIDSSSSIIYLFGQMIITGSIIFRLPLDYTSVSYGHLASISANPSLYSQGYGLGGSYLAESFLAFGLLGCFIIPFILLYTLSSLEKYTTNNSLFYFNYYGILPPVLFIPRETLFYFLPYLIKGICVTLMIILILNIKKRLMLNGQSQS